MRWSKMRWISAATAATAALSFAACGSDDGGSSSESSGGSGSYKIGAPLPLTGEFAPYAKTWRNGLTLAVEEINEAGGIEGKKLELAVEDWAGETAKAVSGFTKLANVDKVPIEISGVSGAIMAMAPVAERSKTPLVNAAAQTPEIRDAGEYTFSIINEATTEAEDLIAHLKDEMGISEAVIYYVDDPTGEGGRDALVAAAEDHGVTVLDTVAHSLEDKNFRTVLAQIKSNDPPAVLVASHWENTGLSLKQAQDVGLETQWLGLSPTLSDVTIETAGKEAVEGFQTVRSQYDVESNKEGTPAAEFVGKYEARFNEKPDIYAAHFYDAVYLAKSAFEAGATDGEAMQEFLAGVAKDSPFEEGVTGATEFDEDGMVRKPNFILTVKDGELVAPDEADSDK